jgi:hypothetical protein
MTSFLFSPPMAALPASFAHSKRKVSCNVKSHKNATSHIIQAISMTVQRGNTTSIMGTLGPLRKLEDFFDII